MSSVVWTATATVGAVYSTVVGPAASKKAHSSSLLAGAGDPTKYNPENPLILVVIQLAVIIGFSRILHIFLGSRWLRQPRVLSEILAGVLLGPTAMGRIPGFSEHIFPPDSLPYLNLLATIGLVLFLFCVGLDTDVGLIRRNLRPTMAVSLAGMAIPFGLGVALSVGLYKEFIDSTQVPFRNFMLFIATASCITAFPVLARILTELKLTSDPVGVIVLASGVTNDVLGWLLLALSVALASASKGQVVVYILLCAIGFTLVLFFIMRPAMAWLGRSTGSYDAHAPNQTYMCAVLILALSSAWVMEEIGVSAIFGGFLCGLAMPSRLGKEVSEKIEDFVLAILVPAYFSVSGLKTNLGLLNSGIRWGWAVCIIAVAFNGKFWGCAIAAKLSGFSVRESGAVGSLMAAKGLIELVVLNIGLQAGIISTTVFSLYVLEALILTFAATPLALAFYPPHIRSSNAQKIDDSQQVNRRDQPSELRHRFTIILERFENLSPLFIFSRLVATPPDFAPVSATDSIDGSLAQEGSIEKKPEITFDTLRLVEMTDRASEAMQASDKYAIEENLRKDPLSSLYATFASLNGINISSRSLSVVQQAEFADTVATKAKKTDSDFVLIPWRLRKPEEESGLVSYIPNPLESLFGKPTDSHSSYTSFLRDTFASAPCDVGIFIERDQTSTDAPGFHHLFLPFHGGSDDRAALDLAVQLAKGNRGISVTVLHITRAGEATEVDKEVDGEVVKMDSASSVPTREDGPAPALQFTIQGASGTSGTLRGGAAGETLYPTQHGLESETADTLSLDAARARAPPSVVFTSISTMHPLRTSLHVATQTQNKTSARFTWVIGRGRRDAASHRAEGLELLRQAEQERRLGVCVSAEVRRCLGESGTAALVSGVGSNLLVIQSRATGGHRERRGE